MKHFIGHTFLVKRCVRHPIFLKVWKHKWSKVLRFRQPSQFAECDSCQQLKKGIREAKETLSLVGLLACSGSAV